MSAHECKYLYATWVQLLAQNEETGKMDWTLLLFVISVIGQILK